MNRHTNHTTTAALAAALALLVLWGAPPAEAQGKQGTLYVNQHLSETTLKETGAALADVYVYKLDGAIVHSGKGSGAFKPGEAIDLPAGDYLVEIGRHRTRYNLQRYTVAPNQTTFVKTGWVSVATWPRADQPKGCATWSARIDVVLPIDGQEHLITSNSSLNPKEYSMVQLPIGTYRVYFNGLATDVEVKEDNLYSLPVGTAGPYRGNTLLAASKESKAGIPSVNVCDGKPAHVLAGTWWRAETIKLEEHPYERKEWSQVDIKTTDGGSYRELPADKVRGHRRFRGAGSKPTALTPQDLEAVTSYKEGALGKSIGGKFKGTALDSLFEDATDVQ